MSLKDFEDRMLKLKGVKLPAVSVIGVEPATQARVIDNPLCGSILSDDTEECIVDDALDDILIGVVRSFDTSSSHKGNKLNVAIVRAILHKIPFISTLAIEKNFGYSRDQSYRYATACRLVIQFKTRSNVRQSFNQLKQHSE